MTISKRPGDINQGQIVARLQNALTKRGFECPASGRFDAHTENAVMQFQRKHGLVPDGIVGPITWAAIGFKGAVPGPVTID
ncbi:MULTISPECIES: peptidoglycan-binding domain-containing protein [unclassified Streptomyces]|uniref:peptidoglycan-binding domain-containing protein n=1 Tax=unclassified Streptomyces TaxID=2593676 RepID=UPI003FD0B43B